MIDFSVNIETCFAEGGRSVSDRVRAAADAGFRAVEIWSWWDKPLAELSRALRETDTRLLTLCVEGWQDKCQLADPQSHGEFVRRVRSAAQVAADLGTSKLVVLAGDRLPASSRDAQIAAVADALSQASDAVSDYRIELLLEVINRRFEAPNALLDNSQIALDLVRNLGRSNVRFLYDRYHSILNEEALGWAVAENVDLIGHIQVAGVPGRHELARSSHDWTVEFGWLLSAGYDRYVGIEAVPVDDSAPMYQQARRLLDAAAAEHRRAVS